MQLQPALVRMIGVDAAVAGEVNVFMACYSGGDRPGAGVLTGVGGDPPDAIADQGRFVDGPP